MMRSLFLKWGGIALVCGMFLSPAVGVWAGQRCVTFILDASGSMWGQIDGKAKIDIAKKVMEELINSLPDDLEAGLVAYGHRRKGDCKDVEELVPVATLDKKKMIAKIQAINPKGKTPMTLSVKQTVEQLKNRTGEKIIILLSDGKETCAKEPCKTIAALKKAHQDFILYVIGFDVTEEEKQQLTCMARAGGGRYFAAGNANELKLAARQVVMESQEYGELEISPCKNGKLFNALVMVYDASGKKRVMTGHSTDLEPFSGKVSPGEYKVVVKDTSVPEKPTQTSGGLKVTRGETTKKSVEFAQEGTLVMQALKDGKQIRALYKVFRAGESDFLFSRYTERGKPTNLKVSTGIYDVSFQDRTVLNKPVRRVEGVEVKAGKPAEAKLEFPQEGTVEVKATQGGAPANVYYILLAADGQRLTQGHTRPGKTETLRVLPGKYTVQFVMKKPKKIQMEVVVDVQSGQASEAVGKF